MPAFSFSGVAHAADLNNYLQDSGWQSFAGSYAANWTDFGSGTEVGRYRKIGRFVEIAGRVTSTAAIAANNLTLIATLPAGYRPLKQAAWAAVAAYGTSGRLLVDTTGAVYWSSPTAMAANTDYSLNGHFAID